MFLRICEKLWKAGKHITGIMDTSYKILEIWDDDVSVPLCDNQKKILFHTHPSSSSKDCASDFPSSNDILITLTKGYCQHLVITYEGVYVLEPIDSKLTTKQASLLNMLYEIERNTDDAWCPRYYGPRQLCEMINKILDGYMMCQFISWSSSIPK
jgi:hypothetical protein